MVEAHGHVSTLLSLQAGLDEELSGRENIALAGALMGIDHKVMETITPGIISFANIGAFIDAPMKTYSSGMRARVGFSIATAVDPDILLLDEVLQTGDNKFKEKSRRRIAEVLQTAKAVVMVTHDMSWITAFCTRAILLDKGHIVAEGDPEEIADMHEDDAERRTKQKRKAKQLIKHGKVDLVDIRKARKTGTLAEVVEREYDLDEELDEERIGQSWRSSRAPRRVASPAAVSRLDRAGPWPLRWAPSRGCPRTPAHAAPWQPGRLARHRAGRPTGRRARRGHRGSSHLAGIVSGRQPMAGAMTGRPWLRARMALPEVRMSRKGSTTASAARRISERSASGMRSSRSLMRGIGRSAFLQLAPEPARQRLAADEQPGIGPEVGLAAEGLDELGHALVATDGAHECEDHPGRGEAQGLARAVSRSRSTAYCGT